MVRRAIGPVRRAPSPPKRGPGGLAVGVVGREHPSLAESCAPRVIEARAFSRSLMIVGCGPQTARPPSATRDPTKSRRPRPANGVARHRTKTGLRSHGRAGWSPTPPASTATEPAVTTTLDSQRTCRRSRGRAPQGSLAPARRSLLALLGPVTTIDWYPMPGTARQFGSAPADTPPSSPRPDGTMPSGKRQRGG